MGRPTFPWSDSACSFCAIGAIAKCYNTSTREQRELVENKLMFAVNTEVAKWNDAPERTQSEVVEMFRSIGE